jgi:hypothetical protein
VLAARDYIAGFVDVEKMIKPSDKEEGKVRVRIHKVFISNIRKFALGFADGKV